MKVAFLFAASTLLAATGALAQTAATPATGANPSPAPAAPADPAPAPAATPAPAPAPAATPSPMPAPMPASPVPAPDAAARTFTDAELRAFALAAIDASKIQQDASIATDEKQQRMLAAVQGHGLDPARYNVIAQAVQADPALKARAEQAAAQPAPAPAG